MTTLVLRGGDASDTGTTADTHMRNWQAAYHGLGILSDAYLGGMANAEMRARWYERMAAPVAGQYVWCAGLDDETIGFPCTMREDNTPWGVLVDNLHLLPTSRGHGVGKRLVGETVRWTVTQGIAQLHLLVYETNTAAVGSYGALGDVSASWGWLETADGGHAWMRTYHWPGAELKNLARLP